MTPPSHPIADALLAHSNFVQRLAASLANGDADDLAQDAWTRALACDAGEVRDVRGWLATIVRNLWRNRRRATGRRETHERRRAAQVCAFEPSVAQIVEREEVRRRVVAAVLQLPEPLRRVVLLGFFEGLDSFAIARRAGMPASTVRARMARALQLLRKRLDDEHGSQRAGWLSPFAAGSQPRAVRMFPTVLRAAWTIRAAVAVVALALVVIATSAPWWSPPPPPARAAPEGFVAAGRDGQGDPRSLGERTAVATSPADAQPRTPDDLWGRVVAAADGCAVADAEVELEHRDGDEMTGLDTEYNERRDVLGSVHTDVDGRFAFRVRRAASHRLTVRANGFATLREYQVTGGSEATLRVERPAFVEGTVKTAAGTALAGVVVEARRKDAWGDPASTVTAADGSFFLGDLGSRLTFLVVRASSFAPPPPRLVELMPGECLHADFVVQPGRVVRGLIRDTSTGAPIVGARAATSWTMRDQGVSGRDGSYELRGVDERAVLHVAADGWAGAMRAVPAGPGPATVDFDLERGVEVTGRVVDEDGNGVAAAFVAAAADEDVRAGSRQTHWRTAVVDADGRFRLTGLARLPTTMTQPAPWRWQLLARAPGHGARVLALSDPARGTASTDLGDVLLLPEGVFEGRLVDSAGNPVGGGRVELRGVAYGLEGLLPPGAPPRSPLFQFGRREAVTAADGIFRFGGVGAGNYRVQARRGSGAAVEGGPYVLVSGSVTTAPDLVLAPGLTISGRLRGACPPGSLRASGIAIHANGGSDVPRCAVGADGTFRLEGLAPGDYLLSATDAPAGYAVVPRRGVTAGSNGVELDIVPAVTIEGRVVAPARGAQSGVNVIFRPQGVRVVKSVSTNAEGRFRIEAAPGVAGTITASHPDDFLRAARVLDVVAGTRDVELELPDHPRFAPVVRPR